MPVLKIGSEWRLDSDNIAHWLDEKFSDRPLLHGTLEEQQSIVTINSWINHSLIPSMFRLIIDWPSTRYGIYNGLRLGKAVHSSANLPMWVRYLWPILIRRAKFIQRIIAQTDRAEPIATMQKRLINEFVSHLKQGPYLGGLAQPTLADASAFPLVIFSHEIGLRGDIPWLADEVILAWVQRTRTCFLQTPCLVPVEMLNPDTSVL